MIAAGDRQLGDRFKHVGATIAVGVLDPGDLLALRDVVAALRSGRCDDAERLVQARGEEREFRLRVGVVGAVDPPDFAAAGGDKQAFANNWSDAAHLEHEVVGHGERDALPVEILPLHEIARWFREAFGGGGIVDEIGGERGARQQEAGRDARPRPRTEFRCERFSVHGEDYQRIE